MAHFYFENTPHGKQKNGIKLNTKTHYDYICREEKYSHMRNREEDLVFTTSGNIPEWADKPGDFWEQAEIHRRKNGRAYREFRIGLQEEFSLAENIELIEQLIKETDIKDHHAYSYAIHDKTATFDKEHKNVHCHLMFNEKVIESDRKLGPEKYFNQYYTNRNDEPTQGYRTSDYFDQKETTVYLRKRWAEIVNEKFKEKDLPCRISEKSLKNQREDLLLEGKSEEAELLNRTPAPHLGSAYRNPQTMQLIMECIKQVDDEAENPAKNAEDTDINNASKQEQNIMIFSNDVVIRKVAREIQQERLRLHREQSQEVARYEAAEIEKEPLIITVENVYSYIDDQVNHYQQVADDKLAAYKVLKSGILSDEKIRLAAQESAFDGQYEKTRKEYAKIAQKLKSLKQKATTLYGISDKTHELAIYGRAIKDLTNKRNLLGKQINYYKSAIHGSHKEAIAEILRNLQAKNTEKKIHAKNFYAEYSMAKNQARKYAAALEKLKNKEMDTILFSDKLPPRLNWRCKIDGIKPIFKMPMMVFKGETYAILSSLPTAGASNNENVEKYCLVNAVKMDDDIIRGKVPLHELKLSQNDSKKWKIISADEIKIVESTDKKFVYLYAAKPQTTKQTFVLSRPRQHYLVQEAQRQRSNSITKKVSHIAETLVDNGKNPHLNVHWNNDEELKKDKAHLAEKKMYSDWEL